MPDDRVLSVVLIPGVLSLENCHPIKMTFVVSHIDAVLFHFTHCHHFSVMLVQRLAGCSGKFEKPEEERNVIPTNESLK